MNVSLLQRVHDHILAEPERFCAAQWAAARNTRHVLERGAPPEGFKCCIAGHVLLLSGQFGERGLLLHSTHFDNGNLSQRAREVLGLTQAQYKELFFPSQWTDPYRSAYYLSADVRAEAAACAGFIAHFLEKHADVRPAIPLADDREPIAHAQHLVAVPDAARPLR